MRGYGTFKQYGEIETSIEELKEGNEVYPLSKIGGNGLVKNASVRFENFQYQERPTFKEFIDDGWEINLTVCVDFTASNDPPHIKSSLHYLDPKGSLNQYQSALSTVGGILQHYDTDKKIHAYGFGAVPSYAGISEVSHCFHLNGEPDPQCNGIEGLMDAYNFTLKNIKLYGPTYFSPCLQAFNTFVTENLDSKLYHVLLILTDGDIHDMSKTKDLIVEFSDKPISIIIVGIGEDIFELMEELDGDDKVLRDSQGRPAKRDIVQFVKYDQCKDGGETSIAEEVLKEVPEQVISYWMSIRE